KCAEYRGIGVGALGVPERDFVTDAAHDGHAANAPVVRCLDRDGDVVGEFYLVRAPSGHHAAKGGYGLNDSLAVVEDDFGLGFVDGENQYRAAFSCREIFDEREEAADEDSDECGNETFPAATANDEEIFLGATYRWRRASSVSVENDEIVTAHRQAENGFQDDKPTHPGLKRFEAGERAEKFSVLDGFYDGKVTPHCFRKLLRAWGSMSSSACLIIHSFVR